MTDEVTEDVKEEVPQYEYAFSIIKDLQGNLAIKPFTEGEPISSEQIYNACHSIIRNIESQDVARIVTQHMVQTAQLMQDQQTKGLVVPRGGLKRVK